MLIGTPGRVEETILLYCYNNALYYTNTTILYYYSTPKAGAHVLIGTPGRVEDVLGRVPDLSMREWERQRSWRAKARLLKGWRVPDLSTRESGVVAQVGFFEPDPPQNRNSDPRPPTAQLRPFSLTARFRPA